MLRLIMLALIVCFALLIQWSSGKTHHHKFLVESTPYSRLCETKEILTINGKFPGPTLKGHRGDRMVIKVYNRAMYNVTLHWHGARQLRNPWADGPEYITQCPIQPGRKYTYNIKLSTEEGTIWWHAHNGWARATVHGMIIVYPKHGSDYPFPRPYKEVPMILGEWWKKDTMAIPGNANKTGGEPISSDAYTINGQPGLLYPCSQQGIFKVSVKHGRTYLFRILNAVMDEELFFAIAKHKLVVVGTDGCYTKPFETEHIMITPGQTMDVLVKASESPNGVYVMAARSYSSAKGAGYDNTTTSAILRYHGSNDASSPLLFPTLPPYNATQAADNFSRKLRSLASIDHPINVPLQTDTHLFFTISVNLLNCTHERRPCTGPLGKRFSSSVNNISFVYPKMSILDAYYYGIEGVFEEDFPRKPPREFDYTAENLPENVLTPEFGTKVMVLEYNASVELILQGTNALASDNHPIHLHGYSFYVVGWGLGNFNRDKDPLSYNLDDPPEETTVAVPHNGWVAIRFRANNPGVWMMHCHLERHQIWGMNMVFVVKNGPDRESRIIKPPRDFPQC